VLHKSHK